MSQLTGLRVCMATSAHDGDDDRIFFKEGRSLARAGAQVTVLLPRGKRIPDQTHGIDFSFYAGGRSLTQRALSVTSLERALVRGRFDVIHAHEPDALVAAVRAKRKVGSRVVFDSHEMWSAALAQRFVRPLWPVVAAAFRGFEERWIARCDAAIGASWAISDYLASCLGRDNVATILNVPVPDVFGEHEGRAWGDETILCHDGMCGFDRGLKTMAEAVRRVSQKHRVVLKIVGDVFNAEGEWLDAFVARHGLHQQIVRTGWLPYHEVGKALAPCHIGLIALQRLPNNIPTSSNKVFNYMLYGIPFIAPSFRLASQKLVAEESCGVLADSSSPESYADAICIMIEDRSQTEAMGQNALRASKDRYRWEHMEPVLYDVYRRIVT